MILVSRISNLVQGHLLDSNVKHVEDAIKFYDPLSYLKWNPKKLQGNGCWELRRRPAEKKVLEVVSYKGMDIQVLGYKEYDWVHCVKDFAYCNYNILTWMQEADSFKNDYARRNGLLGQVVESNADATQAQIDETLAKEEAYVTKQVKGEWGKVMQDLDSGVSLARALSKRGF